MKPDSPEDLARMLADRTAHVRLDPLLASQMVARVRGPEAYERPAYVVLAVAASLVVWLSFGFDRNGPAAGSEFDDDAVGAFDGEESAL